MVLVLLVGGERTRLIHAQFGIGQRAILLQTEYGNVLWDLIAYLDQDTIDLVRICPGISMQRFCVYLPTRSIHSADSKQS